MGPIYDFAVGMSTAVDVRGVTKVYDGKVRALDGVDLKVEVGKAFALLGPNGAGKTTLMRILTTQLKPTSGEAYVFGLDVVHEGAEVRRLVGYVPQEMSVWTDLSGYENLLVYAKIYGIPSTDRKRIIDDALEKMGLRGVANNLVKTYSGGMIRRLEMACAMLIKPKVLFLDEPTIGLDPSARRVVWEVLASFRKEHGVTVFFNTHYMDEADLYSDEIAIINEGRVVKLGKADELKRSVGGGVIQLTLGDGMNDKASSELKSLSAVGDVVLNGTELYIVVEDAETALPEVMEVLRSGGIPVKRVSMNKPTLDDVFLKYAGTRLETGGRVSEVRQMRRMIRRG
jgi:ABC-2 type transport system ATP-binding protein